MTTLTFVRAAETLTATASDGTTQNFPAANLVDSHSNGPWPNGTFPFSRYDPTVANGPEGSYGSYGILIFDVSGRTGMGVHSGRATTPDGLGRIGIHHCTLGCIRTDDPSMATLVALHATDPIQSITVD